MKRYSEDFEQEVSSMDLYQQFIHISRYARWRDDLRRRETWPETVDRYVGFIMSLHPGVVDTSMQAWLRDKILRLEVMPSMRALMTAGEALRRENISGYNCAYLAVNTPRSFAEALYVLMCGTGVGFSCERQEVSKLPVVPEVMRHEECVCIVVGDSKEGWAKAFEDLLDCLWRGVIPVVDYSGVRPAGARLKTFGGRASGPEPLRRLFTFAIETFCIAIGRKLQSNEVHDLMCMIGEVVMVGGVRRSALISLSNLSDQRMRDAKSGQWWSETPWRALANNSVAYTEKPSPEIFLEEWVSLIKSKSGERGIFNRVAAAKQAARWGRRELDYPYGCNPCSEIILRDKQFCNLTEVVARPSDTLETLIAKVEAATILGTLQATLTNFNFLSGEWVKNTKQEALLGVSITGDMDHAVLRGDEGEQKLRTWLNVLRDHARVVNADWAKRLGINSAAAITCVKPSGTVSQLVNSASGIHPRHSKSYIRTVRLDKKDPLYLFLLDQGFPIEDDVMRPDSTAVVSFAIRAPQDAVTRDNVTALQMLNLWMIYQNEWCEHKPSVTISVREHEWVEVGAWVYQNFNDVSGISFLPHTDHIYQQAPYQELTEAGFEKWCSEHEPVGVDWTLLTKYEAEDNTVALQTLACTGNVCELISTED